MSPELACQLAQLQLPKDTATPFFKVMIMANEVYRANTNDNGPLPFAPVDIVFAEYVHFLQQNGTERERDFVLISDKLCRVHTILHIGMKTLKESPTPSDLKDLEITIPALRRQGLLHLITNGLDKKSLKFVGKF